MFMKKTKKELKLFLKIDFIMNFGDYSMKSRISKFLSGDLISRYLKALRKAEYFSLKRSFISLLYKKKLKKLSYKTGIQLAINVFGYGLVLPHHGTIVVGSGNKIGNYCVLHTSTCITSGNKEIGDFFYLSTGGKVIKDIKIADSVSVGANSVLNKDANHPNSFYAGMPAKYVKDSPSWPFRDGQKYIERLKKCESIINKKC